MPSVPTVPATVVCVDPGSGVELVHGAAGLALRQPGGPLVGARVDLLAAGRKPGSDLLFRSVLSGKADVIDATAGLGADAFHLAARGVSVTMVERSTIVAKLLAGALASAASGEYGEAARAAAARLRLVPGEARDVLQEEVAGVVLLDPMFPTHRGSPARSEGAATNKGMSLFRELLPDPPQFELEAEHKALLAAAQRAATRRVVVKRSVRAGPLAGVAPSGSLVGRTVRFDIYAPVGRAG